MSFHPSFLPWSYPTPRYYSSQFHPSCGCPLTPDAQSPLNNAFFPHPHRFPYSSTLTTREELFRPAQYLQDPRLEGIRQLQEAVSAHQAKLDTVIAALEERVARLEHIRRQEEEDSLARGHSALKAVLADLASQGTVTIPPVFATVTGEMAGPTLVADQDSSLDHDGTIDPKILRFARFDTPSDEGDGTSSIPDPPADLLEDIEDDQDPSEVSDLLLAFDDPVEQLESARKETPSTPSFQSSSSFDPGVETGFASTSDANTALTSQHQSQTTATMTTAETTTSTVATAPTTRSTVSTRQLRPRRDPSVCSTSSAIPASKVDGTRPHRRSKTALKASARSAKRKTTGPVTYLPHGTLAKGSGKIRVKGAVWPKSGNPSVRGLGRDIQCDTCGGRAHWTCAGFAEHEFYGANDWTCPDCIYLRENDQPSMPFYYDGACIRPNCVRRQHKKLDTRPEDKQLWLIEQVIGRRLESPATLAQSAKYQFLVKWWDYPMNECTWEPETSFDSVEEVASQFNESAMDEGISPEQMKGAEIIMLEQAQEAFDEHGVLKKK